MMDDRCARLSAGEQRPGLRQQHDGDQYDGDWFHSASFRPFKLITDEDCWRPASFRLMPESSSN
ncbi:MAG: hypothetical protein U0231_15520 [Nitrospiraceae bacterium]